MTGILNYRSQEKLRKMAVNILAHILMLLQHERQRNCWTACIHVGNVIIPQEGIVYTIIWTSVWPVVKQQYHKRNTIKLLKRYLVFYMAVLKRLKVTYMKKCLWQVNS